MHKFSKVENGRKYAVNNKQFQATFPWQDFFPDTSLTTTSTNKFRKSFIPYCLDKYT